MAKSPGIWQKLVGTVRKYFNPEYQSTNATAGKPSNDINFRKSLKEKTSTDDNYAKLNNHNNGHVYEEINNIYDTPQDAYEPATLFRQNSKERLYASLNNTNNTKENSVSQGYASLGHIEGDPLGPKSQDENNPYAALQAVLKNKEEPQYVAPNKNGNASSVQLSYESVIGNDSNIQNITLPSPGGKVFISNKRSPLKRLESLKWMKAETPSIGSFEVEDLKKESNFTEVKVIKEEVTAQDQLYDLANAKQNTIEKPKKATVAQKENIVPVGNEVTQAKPSTFLEQIQEARRAIMGGKNKSEQIHNFTADLAKDNSFSGREEIKKSRSTDTEPGL